VFAIARAKEHIEGCDGPTAVLSYTEKDEFWRRSADITKLEAELNAEDFRAALEQYWASHNPPLESRFVDGGDGGSALHIQLDKDSE
jgi:hypothetical protein